MTTVDLDQQINSLKELVTKLSGLEEARMNTLIFELENKRRQVVADGLITDLQSIVHADISALKSVSTDFAKAKDNIAQQTNLVKNAMKIGNSILDKLK